VLSGREGIERFPPEAEVPFDEAVVRRLRSLDPKVAGNRIRDLIAGRPEQTVIRALHATIRTKPAEVVSFFVKCLGREVATRSAAPKAGVVPIKGVDDPYA
jgi:hypothetical protein